MLFWIFAIVFMLLGLLFVPLVKDITGISRKGPLVVVSMLFGIPIVMIDNWINPKRFDLPDDILNDDDDHLDYPVDKWITCRSLDEYLERIHLEKKTFFREAAKILEAHSNNKDIDGIFLDSEEWMLDVINNTQFPLGIVPVGITVVGDIIGIETQSRDGFSLVVINQELDTRVYRWKDDGNYPELE